MAGVKQRLSFQPDYAVAPGDTLQETIESLGMDQAELARRIAMTPKHVSELISGKAVLTPDTAVRLEAATGVPAAVWSNLEARYREYAARAARLERVQQQEGWAKNFPVKELKERGAIPSTASGPELVSEICLFFGVDSPDAWDKHYLHVEASFRTSTKIKPNRYSTAAWLRLAEREALKIESQPYLPERFQEAVQTVRKLTTRPPNVFLPELQKVCAAAGVVVVLVPPFDGCRASGVAKWLRDDKALIALSLRHKTEDHFWFSFFHEAGHILHGAKKKVYLDGVGSSDADDPDEQKANKYAGELLIPPSEENGLAQVRTAAQVTAFAQKIGIAPGIVVGQLRHRKLIKYTQFVNLITTFDWAA